MNRFILFLIIVAFAAISSLAFVDRVQNEEKKSLESTCVIEKEYGPYKKTIDQLIVKRFIGKQPVLKPTFFVVCGPPGSGKSSIIDHIVDLKEISKNTLVSISIDEIVKEMPCYIDYVNLIDKAEENFSNNEMVEQLFTENTTLNRTIFPFLEHSTPEEYRNSIEEYTRERFKQLSPKQVGDQLRQILYFGYRISMYGDDASTMILDEAREKKFNICWETVGNKVAYLVEELHRTSKFGYRTVILYPFTTGEQLMVRLKKRAETTNQISAPNEQVLEMARTLQENIAYLINYVDKLYIYDNTGSPGEEKLLFSVENVYSQEPPIVKEGKEIENAGPGHQLIIECSCERIVTTIDKMEEKLQKVILDHCKKCSLSNLFER